MRLKVPKQSHSGNAIHCGHFPKTAFQGQGKCWAPLLPFIPLLNLRICAKGGERGREGDEIDLKHISRASCRSSLLDYGFVIHMTFLSASLFMVKYHCLDFIILRLYHPQFCNNISYHQFQSKKDSHH